MSGYNTPGEGSRALAFSMNGQFGERGEEWTRDGCRGTASCLGWEKDVRTVAAFATYETNDRSHAGNEWETRS